MKIPGSSIRTTWKADWLIEFNLAFAVLGLLTRELIFVVVGLGTSAALAALGFAFRRELAILRRSLRVEGRLPRSHVFLGERIDGEFTILNVSKLVAHISAVQGVAEKVLRVDLRSLFGESLRPEAELRSDFTVTSLARGRFPISGYRLTFHDGRSLFTGEVEYAAADLIEVYPGIETAEPLTPLALYGGSLEIVRKGPAGGDYAGTREHMPGDEYYRVEWKATARHQTLMVKEFHPETETSLQILVDAGKTMKQRSYVATRFDEALAVAELLTESAATPGNLVGVWIYNENELVRALKPTAANEQVTNIRELSLTLQGQAGSPEPPARLPAVRSTGGSRSASPWSDRVAGFMRMLRVRLGLGHQRTGVYTALTQAAQTGARGLVIVLTDLQSNLEALLDAASTQQERGVKTVAAQIGAAWRLSSELEEAYVEYQRNSTILQRLQESGLTVFDVRPERLVHAIMGHIAARQMPALVKGLESVGA